MSRRRPRGPAGAPGPLAGAELEVEVGRVAAGGACVARSAEEGPGGGRVVFVRHTLPGERVRARVTEDLGRSYLRADAVEVLRAAPERVAPPCPHAGPGRCGGCDWQHASLGAQRQLKAAGVREQLTRLAGLDPDLLDDLVVEELPGSPDGLGWRTRVAFAVRREDGAVGFHRHRSAEVHPVDSCPIAAPAVTALGVAGRAWPGTAAVEVEAGEEGRVVVVTPARAGAAARPPVLDGAAGTARRDPVTRTVAPSSLPHGVVQRAAGRRFEVTAGGFWQVHPAAAQTLVDAVLAGLDPRPGERALDLYAGAGLFAAALGERVGPAGRVHAVESDPRAGADAARNTADLPQVRVHTTAVAPATLDATWAARPDLVVLDPPRSGAGLAVTRRLARTPARAIAYVACDPASLARDLGCLLGSGWRLAGLRAFDLFPMTAHVECVAVLEPAGPA